MQSLYILDAHADQEKALSPSKLLTDKIAESKELFFYLLYFITETAGYAETDAARRAGKHLPTAADLATSTKIAGNELLWKIKEDAAFQAAVKQSAAVKKADRDLIRATYNKLAASPEYIEYAGEQSRNGKAEKKILEFIFTDLMLPEDDFIRHIEELFMNWDDDAEMMHSLVLSYLQKPGKSLAEFLSADKKKYAEDLLRTVQDKEDVLLEYIKPKLKNWDADRIAALDMILLQMGVSELLYFETIPTKVTINEYIDLAKAYSTPQSGQFVNGLLDNIHKDLQAQNKIHKISHKP